MWGNETKISSRECGYQGGLVDQPIELSSCCFVLCKLRPGVDLGCFMGDGSQYQDLELGESEQPVERVSDRRIYALRECRCPVARGSGCKRTDVRTEIWRCGRWNRMEEAMAVALVWMGEIE